jgi:hypothetical protein
MLVFQLLRWWSGARARTAAAELSAGFLPVDVEDYWTELAIGTRIAHDVTASRWPVVARLLRTGTVRTWSEVGNAVGMDGDAARMAYREWASGLPDAVELVALESGLDRREATDDVRCVAAG